MPREAPSESAGNEHVSEAISHFFATIFSLNDYSLLVDHLCFSLEHGLARLHLMKAAQLKLHKARSKISNQKKFKNLRRLS